MKNTDMIGVSVRMALIWLEHRMWGNLLGDKAVSVIFDNTKIKSFVPDFKATIPFKQGIKRTVEWFEADPSRMVIKAENNDFIDKVIEAYKKK